MAEDTSHKFKTKGMLGNLPKFPKYLYPNRKCQNGWENRNANGKYEYKYRVKNFTINY